MSRRLLPLLLLLLLTPAAPLQAQFATIVNLDRTVTITGGCTGGAVTIPDAIDGRLVKSIGAAAFSGCTSLIGVTIPSSVTSIEWNAF